MLTRMRQGLILLLAGTLAMLLSLSEVRHFLGHESTRTMGVYLSGSERPLSPNDLIGSAPLNHSAYHFDSHGLILSNTGRAAQLSLRLPVNPVDPELMSRVSLSITASTPGQWIAYLREAPNTPAIASSVQHLEAGEQQLVFDLQQILGRRASQDTPSASRLTELIVAPYYRSDARVVIHRIAWHASDSPEEADWSWRTVAELGSLPGQQLAAFRTLKQENPLLLVSASGVSLMAVPRWLSLTTLLVLMTASLRVDWRLRRSLARILWLLATVGSVMLFDFAHLYHPADWTLIAVLSVIVIVPVALHLSTRWPLLRGVGPGDLHILTGLLLIGSAGILLAWLQPQMTIRPLLEQWLAYLPWAFAQQLILMAGLLPLSQLQPVTASRAEESHRPWQHVMPAALLFGWLHYPNLILMAGSAALAAVIMLLWRRGHGWLVTLILHATLGTLALGMAPDHWLISGEIGSLWFE